MEAPFAIASLPKPLDAENGKVRAAPVFGIRESRKRKRHEVAVGIDGESVNVYNIQSQSQIASYALPPQTYLCCPPCSIYSKVGKGSSQRRTYLVTRNGPQDRKRRLICMTEEVHMPRHIGEQPLAPKKQEQNLPSKEVLSVEIVTAGSDPRSTVERLMVFYRDGSVDCMTTDLAQTLWQHKTDGEATDVVENATVADLQSAKKGLLASREDVTALVDVALPNNSNSSDQLLLCQILRTDQGRALRVSSLRLGSRDIVQSQAAGMQLLMEVDLPDYERKLDQQAQYDLNVGSGKLYQLLGGRLSAFDLSGTMPRTSATFGRSKDPVVSFARMSASTVLAVFMSRIEVFETKYGSVQASLALDSSTRARHAGQKRKLDDGAELPWVAVSSFSELGVVAGLAGSELSVVQLSEQLRASKRVRASGALLVDVLGKGALASTHGNFDYNLDAKNEEWRAKVNSTIEEGNMTALEALVTQSLGVQPGEHEERTRFPAASVDRRKAMFVLSKCFRMTREDEQAGEVRLVTTINSATIYKMLAKAGYLSASSVRQALKLRNDSASSADKPQSGDVMAALCIFDNFQLAHALLDLPIHWELPQVVQVLRLMIRSFETPAQAKGSMNALLAPKSTANGDKSIQDGAMEETEVESELIAAERELQSAVMAVSTGLEIRSETMRLVIRRLHAYPHRDISLCMRSMMRPEELLFFMKILRIELLEGGWPSRYIDLGDKQEDVAGLDGTDDATGPTNQAIGTISDMMNCAVDAIGTSGWLIGQSSDVYGTAELIDALKSEVSAALEGLYEADTVATFLRSMAGYERSLEKTWHGVEKRKRAKGEWVAEELEPEEALLPMGCKAEPAVVRSRATKDGKRSKRMFEEERRRRVGLYSIDRIRV
ncbi:hypothetical protein KC332_g4733 [Hortaea werneckii]|uniref:Utp8 beta-propeller domain-containing protein n=1 Tax=Hortaea werneckii EXF-2000 TaxID=1157616 RepID=A0A1Z5T8P9_HORWE|nr:hypothetical protein KC358_g6135 [Hortaea werneckii]OTA32360.1 hypothetical protein BTJ68_07949 [Hortaea werneckii EXF-2000]KAI6841490.1 hypothetical protein KC350_g5250 [Hortaea werneckii]KAI6934663.1 hypothetical protein KC348_g6419 [Hortaea werneckii]KAI6938957.1 hypothetical protein KC341_g4533 [Hortaea werneckii]